MIQESTSSKNIQRWLDEPYDTETKGEIRRLLTEKSPDLENSFYKQIEFGTGGMRGLMGIGTNRMNVYTIRQASQGLANYLARLKIDKPSVLIGYDARENSHLFAEEAARVFLANGIEVFFFTEIRPTPLVSFGCRFKKTSAAIMITASHNPPQYNGFKVYWSDGAQVLPPHDVGIVEEVSKISSLSEVKRAESLASPLFKEILHEVDEAYLKAQDKSAFLPDENKKYGADLKLLYTSLHGTGITLLPTLLKRWGFSSMALVAPQCMPDSLFTYAPLPNPEEPSALKMGTEQLLKEGHDLLIATDPDADRMGVVVHHKGKGVPLTGNEIASICLYHIVSLLKKREWIGKPPAFIKSLVTTELFRAIGSESRYPVFDVLPGFKYIAELIRNWETDPKSYQYVFGGEESYGYLLGDSCRDKDALIAAALIAEVALRAKRQGKTLVDLLETIFQKYGLYIDLLHNIKLPDSKESLDKMKEAMERLRKDLPKELAGIPIVEIIDYNTHDHGDHRSNILRFHLKEGTKLILRPSGTEPKMKIYCGLFTQETKDLAAGRKLLDEKAKKIIAALESLLSL